MSSPLADRVRLLYRKALTAARDLVDIENRSVTQAMRGAVSFAGGELVDVGCGDKPYFEMFSPHVTKYVGVEYDETYGTSAQAALGRAEVVYSGDRLPFEDARFDTVLSNQVAEHVPDPRAFFAELVRVLRPGGCLILTVPFSYRIHSEPHDYHRFTKYALKRYAEDFGLTIERLSPRGGFWAVIGQKLASRLALGAGRLGPEIQRTTGAFGYEPALRGRPRYWALPVVAPALVVVAVGARILDQIDWSDSDTLGYLLVARKPALPAKTGAQA
jgi:SAM-dependent methyltransferase